MREQQENEIDRNEINNVSCINNTPADGGIVGIDANLLHDVINLCIKDVQLAQKVKGHVKEEAEKNSE